MRSPARAALLAFCLGSAGVAWGGTIVVQGASDLAVSVVTLDGVEYQGTAGQYSVPDGSYKVRVRPKVDLAWVWSWSTTVDVGSSEVKVTPPESARTPSLAWRVAHERLLIESLAAEVAMLRKQQSASEGGLSSLGWGAASLAAGGLFVWAGLVQRRAYEAAMNADEASSLHIQLSLLSVGVVATGAGALWGLTSGLLTLAGVRSSSPAERELLEAQTRLEALISGRTP